MSATPNTAAGRDAYRPSPGRTPRHVLAALVRLARPRQWTKNALVLVVPLAAGRIIESDVLLSVGVAFACFCAAASAVYMINDVRDADADRAHPTKRARPVAAGDVSPAMAVTTGGLLAAAAIVLAMWWSTPLGLTVLVYLLIQAAYAAGLKDQPVMDLAVVASGFLLRTVAGATATGIRVSAILVIVATFGSLFMVAGKRYSELRKVGAATGSRASLDHYSESYLRFVWTTAAIMTVVGYLLWSRGQGLSEHGDVPWGAVSLIPFVLAMLRYAVDIDRGTAGAPEDIVLGDRVLQTLGLFWLLTVLPAVVR